MYKGETAKVEGAPLARLPPSSTLPSLGAVCLRRVSASVPPLSAHDSQSARTPPQNRDVPPCKLERRLLFPGIIR